MLRRTGFARPAYEPPPRAPVRPATRRAVLVASNGVVLAVPKLEPKRAPALLRIAKGKPCLLMIPRICTNDTETTVACHQNEGKGMAQKRSDEFHVWGCAACHRAYDQGPMPREQKRAIFDAAMLRQKLAWFALSIAPDMPKTERKWASWALGRHASNGGAE